MAKKPTSTPELEVTAEVLDALIHDDKALGPGDVVTLPLADAVKLRSLGVIGFDDPALEA